MFLLGFSGTVCEELVQFTQSRVEGVLLFGSQVLAQGPGHLFAVLELIAGVYPAFARHFNEDVPMIGRIHLSLDQTIFNYQLIAECSDGKADVRLTRITYDYDVERNPIRYAAEQWITDKDCVNKKHTKLLPLSGKFRRKTIDRKDFIFNKFNTLLNDQK